MSQRAEPAAPDFVWPVRVYFEDTDAGGVVYHAGYLRYYERCRSEWLRHLGLDQHRLMTAATPIAFAVRSMAVDWLAPARLDDQLAVQMRVSEMRRASMRFEQAIVRSADGAVLSRAQVRAACVSIPDFRPLPIPDDLLETLRA